MISMTTMTEHLTDPVSVQVHRAGTLPKPGELEADLARVQQVAKLLDAQFEIGGIKFGWDAILGLVPVAGDIVTTLIGIYPLYVARKQDSRIILLS